MEYDKETRKPNMNSINHYNRTTTPALLSHHVTKSWKIGDRLRWKAERQEHIISKLCSASDYGKQPVTPALCNSIIKIPHISFSHKTQSNRRSFRIPRRQAPWGLVPHGTVCSHQCDLE